MIITPEETKEWLRVDGNEDDSTIDLLIKSAEEYLKNATGRVFDSTNNQARLFCLVLVTDWFENRDLIGTKVSEKVRYSLQSMLLQMEYTEGVEESGKKE